MAPRRLSPRRAALLTSISTLCLLAAPMAARAQTADIGAIDVQSTGAGGSALPPITSDRAIGSKAPPG